MILIGPLIGSTPREMRTGRLGWAGSPFGFTCYWVGIKKRERGETFLGRKERLGWRRILRVKEGQLWLSRLQSTLHLFLFSSSFCLLSYRFGTGTLRWFSVCKEFTPLFHSESSVLLLSSHFSVLLRLGLLNLIYS